MSFILALDELDRNLKDLEISFEVLPEKKRNFLMIKHGEATKILESLYFIDKTSDAFKDIDNLNSFSSKLASVISLLNQLNVEFLDAKSKEEKLRLKIAKGAIQKEQHDFLLQEKKLKLETEKQKGIDRHNKQCNKNTEKKYKVESELKAKLLEKIKKEETQIGLGIEVNNVQYIKITNRNHLQGVPKFEVLIHTDREENTIKRFFNYREIEEFVYRELKVQDFPKLCFYVFDLNTEVILKTNELSEESIKDKSKFMDNMRKSLSYIDKDLITQTW